MLQRNAVASSVLKVRSSRHLVFRVPRHRVVDHRHQPHHGGKLSYIVACIGCQVDPEVDFRHAAQWVSGVEPAKLITLRPRLRAYFADPAALGRLVADRDLRQHASGIGFELHRKPLVRSKFLSGAIRTLDAIRRRLRGKTW